MDRAALEKMTPAEDRFRLAQAQDRAREFEEGGLLAGQVPIKPRQRRILAIGVVVAVLRMTELVAGQQHRHTLREEQRGEEVPLLPCAKRRDFAVLRRAFLAAVPAIVIVAAVAIL